MPGLVKLVSREDIEAADWSLTPGRYVGAAPPEVDVDFDFELARQEKQPAKAGAHVQVVVRRKRGVIAEKKARESDEAHANH